MAGDRHDLRGVLRAVGAGAGVDERRIDLGDDEARARVVAEARLERPDMRGEREPRVASDLPDAGYARQRLAARRADAGQLPHRLGRAEAEVAETPLREVVRAVRAPAAPEQVPAGLVPDVAPEGKGFARQARVQPLRQVEAVVPVVRRVLEAVAQRLPAVASLLGFGRLAGAAATGAQILIGIVLILFLLVIFGVIAIA